MPLTRILAVAALALGVLHAAPAVAAKFWHKQADELTPTLLDGLRLEPDRYGGGAWAIWGDKRFFVTGPRYAALSFLHKNAHRVVTTNDIKLAVWGDREVAPNTPTDLIRRLHMDLQQKLGLAFIWRRHGHYRLVHPEQLEPFHGPQGLVLDPARYEIHFGNKTLRVRPRAFETLLYMVQNRKKGPISRQEIVRAIFGDAPERTPSQWGSWAVAETKKVLRSLGLPPLKVAQNRYHLRVANHAWPAKSEGTLARRNSEPGSPTKVQPPPGEHHLTARVIQFLRTHPSTIFRTRDLAKEFGATSSELSASATKASRMIAPFGVPSLRLSQGEYRWPPGAKLPSDWLPPPDVAQKHGPTSGRVDVETPVSHADQPALGSPAEFVLSSDGRHATMGTRMAHLSPREYQAAVYLLKHAGRNVPETELHAAVWGGEHSIVAVRTALCRLAATANTQLGATIIERTPTKEPTRAHSGKLGYRIHPQGLPSEIHPQGLPSEQVTDEVAKPPATRRTKSRKPLHRFKSRKPSRQRPAIGDPPHRAAIVVMEILKDCETFEKDRRGYQGVTPSIIRSYFRRRKDPPIPRSDGRFNDFIKTHLVRRGLAREKMRPGGDPHYVLTRAGKQTLNNRLGKTK